MPVWRRPITQTWFPSPLYMKTRLSLTLGYRTACLGQKEGIQAANAAKIPGAFHPAAGQELIESRSDSLNALNMLTIH